tara:strand:- start:95 stop:856 length:762 start_codon:yes stop_codon:yes gene_type:complete
MQEILASNKFYVFSKFVNDYSNLEFFKKSRLSTIFVIEGRAEFIILNSDEKITIIKGQGLILIPNINLKAIQGNFVLLESCSFEGNKEIIEIIDNDGKRTENILDNYKIIKSIKKVIKPWGYEKWISWFKHHHVLKEIYMTKGEKCSLQFHRHKYETNIIVKGSAKLLKGIIIKDNLKEHEALDEYNKRKDLKKFFKKAETGFYWSNVPNEIHRVFSIDDYISYETSTPELDDVIRIKDDTMRASGLILSEHK